MPASKVLRLFLDKNKVKYKSKKHVEAYTAQETAHAQHVPGKFLAKSVIVKLDSKLIMIVVPAHFKVDLIRLKKMTQAKTVRLAAEKEFADIFPDCDVGAMPPFGNLYNIPVGLDKELTVNEYIVFNAGSHKDTITMRYADFEKLVQPRIAAFGKLEGGKVGATR